MKQLLITFLLAVTGFCKAQNVTYILKGYLTDKSYQKVLKDTFIDWHDGSTPGVYHKVLIDAEKEHKYWVKQLRKDSIATIVWHKKNIDSCDGCIFMGLNREEWKMKDKPFWDSIDRKAIENAGGLYIGDLPSSIGGMTMGHQGYYEVHIYHPSIDSTQIEKHYLIRRRPSKTEAQPTREAQAKKQYKIVMSLNKEQKPALLKTHVTRGHRPAPLRLRVPLGYVLSLLICSLPGYGFTVGAMACNTLLYATRT